MASNPIGPQRCDPLVTNFVAHLRALAQERPDEVWLTVAGALDGEDVERSFTYAVLEARVRALAATLQSRFARGDRALVALDNDEHYVVSMLACFYSGVIALPALPPDSTQSQRAGRLTAIAADAGACCVLTSSALMKSLDVAGHFGKATILCVDAIDAASADQWHPWEPDDDDIAFLQYTSGSTAAPKGVIVTHGNLIANERAIRSGFGIGADDKVVLWAPLYHDMGLIGGLLQPLYSGIPLVLTSPRYFLERPVRWLQLIARHRGTVSGGPDFAYRLCTERVKETQLDLSSWRVAYTGAEPVRSDTMSEFCARFGPTRFDPASVYACYGLAEATLFVTGAQRGKGMTVQRFDAQALTRGVAKPCDTGVELVGCGAPSAGHEVEIVDPQTQVPVDHGRIGEIWANGPSIAAGYWGKQAESDAAFVVSRGRRWLRTGDLGFIHAGQLYVAGRVKDLIVIRGQNVYPQDVERCIESHVDAVRKGRVAAFAVQGPRGEGIGVAAEVSRGMQKLIEPQRLVDALGDAVSEAVGEPLSVVVLLNPGGVPITSSGKLQRNACRAGWTGRTLDAYAIYEYGACVMGANESAPGVLPDNEIERALAGIWADVLGWGNERPVSRDTHFFSAGGDSLAAVQAATRIAQHWRIDFAARDLFERPRLAECAKHVTERCASGTQQPGVEPMLPLDVADRGGACRLSSAQERQWFLWHLDPLGTAYHVAGALRLTGALDADALRAALDGLVARHASLRTSFALHEGVGRQQVHAALALPWVRVDLRELPAGARNARARTILAKLGDEPFDLATHPLIRAALIRLDDDTHVFALVMHHIVSDGASMKILIDEIGDSYRALRAGKPSVLPSLRVQYVDYAEWQRSWLASDECERQLDYWRAQLQGEQTVLALPTDYPRRAVASYRAGVCNVDLRTELIARLRGVALECKASLFITLLAGFQVLLQRYSGQNDIRVGVPVANRGRIETEGVVGFFVNTLVLRNVVTERCTLMQVLDRARETSLGAQAHQDLPFDKLVEALQPERTLNHNPLFQVLFNYLRSDYSAFEQATGLTVVPEVLPEQTAQFELTLDVSEHADGSVSVSATYAAELFDESTIGRMMGHYVAVLEALAWSPEQAVADVRLLDDAQREVLLRWGENRTRHDGTQPVHVLFERQVEVRPDAVALIYGDTQLSYRELNDAANRVAHELIARGVGPEVKVGLALERGIGMAVGVLGVLKSGGAYVPLDPQYPAERLSQMMEDSGLRVVLCESALRAQLPQRDDVTLIALDTLDLSSRAVHNPGVPLHGGNLAYQIYTSGSTGRPKGIGITHAALAEHSQVTAAGFGLQQSDRMLQFSTINFDGFIEQFFTPLILGASMVLRGPALWDSGTFYREVIERGISVADLPTAYWHLLAQDFAQQTPRDYGSLRQVRIGGEAMPSEGVNAWRDAGLSHVRLLNTYGPTEAVVTATAHDCAAYVDGRESLPVQMPVGRPLAGRHVYVLDAELNLAPVGVAGELYIGGALLARGYHGRAGLSAERFVADPFAGGEGQEQGDRLYRTGDVVRWNGRGELEYLGRTDHQVKVRGFRIELGEIEAQLLAQSGVREAVVVARQGVGGAKLVGYVSMQADHAADALAQSRADPPADPAAITAKLHASLAAALPDYMVPSALMVLASLPLNANGKVDRHALPEPHATQEAAYEAPQSEAEKALAQIWSEVLAVEKISRHDNFFELGGHSLLAIKIVGLFAQRYGCDLPSKAFFTHSSLSTLAATLPAGFSVGADVQRQLADMADFMNELEA